MRTLRFLIGMLSLAALLQAENVSGTILIRKRLTKRSVTQPVPVYQRGPAVELGRDPEEDPLVYERSRVVVYVDGPGPSDPVHLSMQQVGRRFSPELLVAPAGSTISFPNMDPIFHNVFSLSGSKAFDLGNYPKGDTRLVTFSKPGIVYVNCHLHPNMAGAVVITPNQWYTKPDSEGGYMLQDVPPGSRTIVVWHKSAGFFRKRVQVEAGHDLTLDFFIPIGDDEPNMAPRRK